MKLGTETGSLVNHLMTHNIFSVPSVGDGATICGWSDRFPATVVEVIEKGKSVVVKVQSDNYTRVDNNGISESQTYEYSRNVEGAIYYYKLKTSGEWYEVYKNKETGRWIRSGGANIYFGHRERYYDFTF